MQKVTAFALTTLVVSLSTQTAMAAPAAPSPVAGPHPVAMTCTGKLQADNAEGKDAVVHLTIEPRKIAGRASASESTYRIELAFDGATYRGTAAATSNFDKNVEEAGHMPSPMFATTLRSTPRKGKTASKFIGQIRLTDQLWINADFYANANRTASVAIQGALDCK